MSTATAVKERPILMSAPMVRAINLGLKTQTRRIIKPQPSECIDDLHGGEFRKRAPYKMHDYETGRPAGFGFEEEDYQWRCPYGEPGDRLWVREAWNVSGLCWGMKPSNTRAATKDAWRYAADDETGWQHGWKPSIHMPRWASRLTLEITDVRVERLNEISEEDAIAEGVSVDGVGNPGGPMRVHQRAFKILWNQINGPDSWAANPWVWAITFRRTESP